MPCWRECSSIPSALYTAPWRAVCNSPSPSTHPSQTPDPCLLLEPPQGGLTASQPQLGHSKELISPVPHLAFHQHLPSSSPEVHFSRPLPPPGHCTNCALKLQRDRPSSPLPYNHLNRTKSHHHLLQLPCLSYGPRPPQQPQVSSTNQGPSLRALALAVPCGYPRAHSLLPFQSLPR